MSTTLSGTALAIVYWIFGVSSDADLIVRMTWIGFWYTLIVGLYSAFFPAPYGRYSSSSLGPTINAKIGWMLQECPVVVMPILLYLNTPCELLKNPFNVIPMCLIVLHYFNRSFIYPLRLSGDAKPLPLATVLSAVAFCSFNGFLQSQHLLNTQKITGSIVFIVLGTLLFLTGMAINIYHDELLSALKKDKKGGKSYKIPQGGLFSLISGANYFGEIVEWCGLALITRQYPQIIFAMFTATFLGLRALHHHQFYKKTFGNSYPSQRRAVVPYLL